MKKLIFISLVLLLISFVSAQDISNMQYNEISIDVNIDSGADIEYLSSSHDIDYVFVNLTYFPREDNWQVILSKDFTYGDEFEENDNYLYYRWNDPTGNRLNFGLDFNVNSKFKFEHVKNEIKFPLDEEDLPEEVKRYLSPTETINSDDIKIIEQATYIAEGKDDLYRVVFDTGIWVKDNINYNLNTLTENVQQNARWVLDHKEGVCDEITVLFIAMLRSVGIPAKFVSGQTYSNLIDGFGNHAWTEVYFPGEGWVSFDVTYGQFGYVDASHIKFKESLDAKESSINYGWKSNHIEIEFDPLDIKTDLLYTGEGLNKKVDLDVNLLVNEVSGGSYVPVEIKIKNLKNYYIPVALYLTKAPSIVEDNVMDILLKPDKEKSVFWIMEVPNNLESGYTYTSNIEFVDYFGSMDNEDLKYSADYDYYSLEEAEEKVSQLEEVNDNDYNNELEIECKTSKKDFYTYEKGNIICSLKNKGNVNLNDLNVCFLDKCRKLDLLINMEEEVYFEFETNIESKEYFIIAENEDITKYYYININIVDSPNLRTEDLVYNNEINFRDIGQIKFNLNSDAECYDVIIRLGKREIFSINKFDGSDFFLIPFKGGFFYGKNKNLNMEYKDNNGKKYFVEEELNINVVEAPFYIKILNFIGLI